jgi:L,D-transpeptidase ErfK/SrfK
MRTVIASLLGILVSGAGTLAAPPRASLAGTPFDYSVAAGDSLDALAARFGVAAASITRRNGLKPGVRLKAGTLLRIDAAHIVPASDRTIIINLPQRMLFVLADDGVHSFPIAAGRPSWQTPRGTFTVETKETDPTWDVPESIQAEMRRTGKPVLEHVPPSPENPLGEFWLGLSLPGIGIHGTNAPLSIHKLTTHGCIRVHPDRIGELYDMVAEGTDGEIVYEPLLLAIVGGHVYVEANPDAYRRSPVTIARLREMAEAASATALIDWTLAADAVALKEGVAVDVSARLCCRCGSD